MNNNKLAISVNICQTLEIRNENEVKLKTIYQKPANSIKQKYVLCF